MLKVSVIVPTYRSGEDLQRVVDSIDAQTLPADEFEVVFVDDGSPDDTHDRLLAIAAERANVVVHRIENSGWPSRPRNLGIDVARGEYVLFMDHDDGLFPGALEAGYAAAAPHRADIVNPKEIRTRGASWGWATWQSDLVLSGDDLHVRWILPMTPHKLYRTEFLREHGIRFREGTRILWEDNYFNVEAYAHARTLVVMSSSPFYLWWTGTGTNSSATYTRSSEEWWVNTERLLDFGASDVLTGEDRHWFLKHLMRVRLLPMFKSNLERRSTEFQAASRTRAIALAERAVPRSVDADLEALDAARAELLRAEDYDALAVLARIDDRMGLRLEGGEVAWDGRELVARSSSHWLQDEDPLPFRQTDGRLYRVLPGLEDRLSTQVQDVIAAVEASEAQGAVLDRASNADWRVQTTTTPRTVPLAADGAGDLVTVVDDAVSRISVDRDGARPPLDGCTWDVSVRTFLMGTARRRAIRYAGPPLPAVVDGRVFVAYGTRMGTLSIDAEERIRPLLTAARVAPNRARVRRLPDRSWRLVLPLRRLHVVGTSRLDCEVVLRPSGAPDDGARDVVVPAAVSADDSRARIVAELPTLRRGRHEVLVRRVGRTTPARVRLTVGLLGRIKVTAAT